MDPTTGTYTFNVAQNGLPVTITYSFNIQYETETQTDSVPGGGGTVSPSDAENFYADSGVIYYDNVSPPTGTALVKVAGSPSTGQYQVTGVTGTTLYHFAAGTSSWASRSPTRRTPPPRTPRPRPSSTTRRSRGCSRRPRGAT